MKDVMQRTPVTRPVTVEEVGAATAALASDAAGTITGSVIYIDSGFNVMA